jgi:hypothetical protein
MTVQCRPLSISKVHSEPIFAIEARLSKQKSKLNDFGESCIEVFSGGADSCIIRSQFPVVCSADKSQPKCISAKLKHPGKTSHFHGLQYF